MSHSDSLRRTLDFCLFDWLQVQKLADRPRFSEHSRDTYASVLDTCQRIAAEKFAPFNRAVDTQEPRLEGEKVILPPCAYEAARAYVDSGMLSAAQDYELGGMQLPCTVEMAANVFFAAAGIGLGGGALLTVGNANLIMAHGSDAQRRVFAQAEFSGRWFGTMCLSEPQAGSSLSDITTRAVPDGADFETDALGPRYRVTGNKMWISNGDHDMSENIVHLVLAKIPQADGSLAPGAKSISLFIVPKHLADPQGSLTGERNDVTIAGLNHKLGYRGLPNTLMNFGEGRHAVRGAAGAIGYRVGAAGDGLRCMFHMMNEARIAVGLGATALGYAGFSASLDYARTRRQGRPVGAGGKNAAAAPVRIIEHADVKRMLLAQKSYVEGALALELYCARLVDEQHTGESAAGKTAELLLEVLTPIAKSWPSEWCLEANSLAIQVHGGSGYTRDFIVEQLWRDNRLNMIHEGTHGIQALDLLGRKVLMHGGGAFRTLELRMGESIARGVVGAATAAPAAQLDAARERLRAATQSAWQSGVPEEALANATAYLQAFGHVVIAWMWLELGMAAQAAAQSSTMSVDFTNGKLQAMRYFFDHELPKIDAWLKVASDRSAVCREMREEWF